MRNHQGLDATTRGHMSDADRLMDCLCSAKERSMMYAKAALESTNNGMREFFLAMHGEETHNHEVMFSFLHTRGFYPTEMVSDDRISDVRKRFQKLHDEMGLTDNPSVRRYQTADPKEHPAVSQNPDHFRYPDRGH